MVVYVLMDKIDLPAIVLPGLVVLLAKSTTVSILHDNNIVTFIHFICQKYLLSYLSRLYSCGKNILSVGG